MARWNSCNVLGVGTGQRRIWQFEVRKGRFVLHREHATPAGEPLPRQVVSKNWGTLFQPKLNVAWLPSEHVFLRVTHLPPSSPEETRSMVELQLEKLSPIPLTQVVWTMHILPPPGPGSFGAPAAPAGSDATATPGENLQTVIVTIVERSVVEEFLGRLEGEGYLADRLESPVLDQLEAAAINEDGAWVYPEVSGAPNTALVAWWYDGVLQNVDFLTVAPDGDRVASLRDQLMQMTWAGELEGWLKSPPVWQVVASEQTAAEWIEILEPALDQEVKRIAPVPEAEVAVRTAKRAGAANGAAALLPLEFATRYQRQFVDRLWGRGLLAVLGLYVIGLAIYFVALSVLNYKTTQVETQVQQRANSYTNAIQLKAQYDVLKEREELKYAALDAWLAVAELLPENITLETLNFDQGRLLRLNGTAPADQALAVIDFKGKLARATVRNQQLFDVNAPDRFTSRVNPNAGVLSWGFVLLLKRGEDM